MRGFRTWLAVRIAPWLKPTWATHMQDDDSFREVYVDRDVSRWGPNITATTDGNGTVHVVWRRWHETG